MSLNTVGNTLIPIVLFDGTDPARASNFGNGFFGLGYVVTPLLIVFIMKTLNLGYGVALIIIGILSLVFLAVTLMTSFPPVSTGYKFSKALKVLFKPAVLVAALALFCYTSLDATMGTWIKKLMEELYGGSDNISAASNSGLVLSLFGLSMMTGRFLFSTIKNLTAIGPKVIFLMSILSVLAISLMIIAKGPVFRYCCSSACRFGFCPNFPNHYWNHFCKV